MEDVAFKAQAPRLTADATVAQNGSISAEHGLGQAKREAARRYKHPLEQELVRTQRHPGPQGADGPDKVL